jgi:2-polyprenyl-3-methyl-5-hydroxy-6-metoxy-1,4-benzoquinol methylase
MPESLRTATRSSRPILFLKGLVRPSPDDVHNELYSPAYYQTLDEESARSAPAIIGSIIRDLEPRTLLDVGCGSGALLAECRRRGIAGTGLEYSDAGLALCRSRGLRVQRFDLERERPVSPAVPYDVVLSLEVAEHLPPPMADRFVDTLVSQLATAGAIVFSAATPGQGGTDHVNEQPPEYWIAKFATHGIQLDDSLTGAWRAEWQDRVSSWYARNTMVFRQGRG